MVEASQTLWRSSYWTLEVEADRDLEEEEEEVVVVDLLMSGEVGEVDGQEEEADLVSSWSLVLLVLLVLLDRVGWEFALDLSVEEEEAPLARHCSSAWFSFAPSLHTSHTVHCSWSASLLTQYSPLSPLQSCRSPRKEFRPFLASF